MKKRAAEGVSNPLKQLIIKYLLNSPFVKMVPNKTLFVLYYNNSPETNENWLPPLALANPH